jgi:hypothetical protein
VLFDEPRQRWELLVALGQSQEDVERTLLARNATREAESRRVLGGQPSHNLRVLEHVRDHFRSAETTSRWSGLRASMLCAHYVRMPNVFAPQGVQPDRP